MSGVLADVSHAKDPVRRQLPLHLQAPVLDHARPSVRRVYVRRSCEVQLSWVKIRRSRVRWEPRSQIVGRVEIIPGEKCRVGLKSSQIVGAEVSVLYRRIDDAVTSADDGVVAKNSRLPGKSKTRPDIL